MNERTLIKQATATLNLPTPVSDFINCAYAIGSSMDGNPNFPASAATVTQLKADTKILDDLETECKVNPLPKTTKARDVARKVVENDLRNLRLEVQKVANVNMLNAEAIIKSAGMSVKNPTLRGKQQNTADDGIEEGTVDLTAEGPGPHEWRKSTDGNSWMLLPSSRTSKTTVSDLTAGEVYYFQNRRMLTNDEKTEWSQSIRMRVR